MSDLVTRLSVLAEDDGDRYPAHVKKLAEDAANRIAALEAQLAEARKALEPFALVAEHDISEDETDSDAFRPMPKPFNHAPRITVGHLRAALAVVREAK